MAKKRRDVTQPGPAPETRLAPVSTSVSDLSPEELRTRLESLRPRLPDVHAATPITSFLTFWIADEQYALPLARAREIVRCETVTKVPDTPPWLRGVTNIRGNVIPVVDLAPRLGCGETPCGRRAAILLIEMDWTGECMVLGLLVEAVGRVVGVAPAEIEAAPPFGTRIKPNLLAGVLPVNDRFALILDIDSALSANELLPHSGSIGGADVSGLHSAGQAG
jgi:purine-binding chemotaxis protein CheW